MHCFIYSFTVDPINLYDLNLRKKLCLLSYAFIVLIYARILAIILLTVSVLVNIEAFD